MPSPPRQRHQQRQEAQRSRGSSSRRLRSTGCSGPSANRRAARPRGGALNEPAGIEHPRRAQHQHHNAGEAAGPVSLHQAGSGRGRSLSDASASLFQARAGSREPLSPVGGKPHPSIVLYGLIPQSSPLDISIPRCSAGPLVAHGPAGEASRVAVLADPIHPA